MTERQEQRVGYLQYLNTFLLSIISIFSVMAWSSLNEVKTKQVEVGEKLIKMQTIQDQDLSQMKDISSRMYIMEMSTPDILKVWVEKNYVRKPQR